MTLRKLIAMFIAAAGIGVAQAAETVYKTAWVQNFEDATTYTNELRQGSVASAVLGTSASTPVDLTYAVHTGAYTFVDSGTVNCQISCEERTAYDGTTGHCLRGVMRGNNAANLMFMMPAEATTATDYVIEFDHYLGPSYTNGGNSSSNGFAIVGAKGILASFSIGPVSSSDSYSIGVYRGDDMSDCLSSGIRTGTRGSVDVAAYWMHVTVRGTAEGVFLSVKNANGGAMDEVKLQDDFDVVSSVYFRCTAKNYKHGFSIDDVIVSLPTAGSTFTWTGAAGDALWSTPGNWLDGEDVALSAPNELAAVVIPADEGVIYIETNVVYKSLAIGSGSRFGLLISDVTEKTAVFALPKLSDGSTLPAEQVEVCGPYEKGVTEDGSAITAVRVPSTFVWSVGEGPWQLASNWKVGELVSGDVPGVNDQIVFPESASLEVNSTSLAVSNVEVGTEAVLSISGNKNLYALMFKGEGSLRLNGGTVGNFSGNHATISNDIEVVEGTENFIHVGNGGGYQISLFGNLSGSGTLRVNESKQNSAGLRLYSEDNSSFLGTLEVYNPYSGAQRSLTQFHDAGASSSNAIWTLRGNANGNTFQNGNKTYYFGALNGMVYEGSTHQNIVLEIGARNVDCSFSGKLSRDDDSEHKNYGTRIRKVGTAKLSIDTTNTGTVEINGGTFEFVQSNALPHASVNGDYWIQFGGGTLESTGLDVSALVKKSLAPVSISVPAESNDVWQTVLASSNVGGLTKKGAGTLTLAADANQTLGYSGYTRVEAGKLVVPADTHYKWDITSPVALATAVEGATPTVYGVGTAQTNWVYGVNTWSDAAKTVDLTNLAMIDLTSVKTIGKGETFVIMTAKAYQVNGAAMTKAQREAIVIELADEVKEIAAAKDYALRIEGNDLVYAPRRGIIIVFR